MEKKEILMKNEEAVRDFGREMGKNLSSGSIVALTGDLGTGKTTLTKAIAEGLGVTETITSPTFNIVKQYESGRLPLYHFDVYRIGDVEEMYELGYEEYFFGSGICVIEWAELIDEIIPHTDRIRTRGRRAYLQVYILGIETTGAFASAAVMRDDQVTGYIKGNDRFSHLQNLTPQIEQVIKESGIALADLDVIAVSHGPGSFTGIRIGVSTARALSQILGTPCAAVSSLEALALNAAPMDSGVLVCPMLDARRNQIYGGGYILTEEGPKEKIKAGPYMLDEFMSKTENYRRILLLGDATDRYGREIGQLRHEGVDIAAEGIRYQDAVSVARLGSRIYAEGGGVGYSQLEPDYMRLAEAERKLRRKQQEG